ncbi:MAG: hypothetical protein A2Y88_09705 [Chloroflexi bacterium RBG_13_48_10]|nr:MAG: hypothetical protein A2Y88_09705 [Chloroflexi bacterium RBG_13_48_10]
MSQYKNNKKPKNRNKKLPWPIIILFGGGLLLLIGAFLVFNKPTEAGVVVVGADSPSLKVDKEKVDLGDVKLGQTVMVSFQLTNQGDKTLKFTKAPYIEVLEGC